MNISHQPRNSHIHALGQAKPASIINYPRALGDKVSRGLWHFDFENLCTAAMRRTGLDDFGSPPLIPALPILLGSLEHEAGLGPLGRFLMWTHLRDLLENRLRLTEAWKKKSEAMQHQRIKRPVFIVGLPRSGSTFLHELLTAEGENRAPRVWEVMYPSAAGEGDSAGKKHIRKAEACLWWFRRLAPQADSVYPMRAQTPHECGAIQSYTFSSEEFVTTCKIPAYEAFLHVSDLTPAYLWEKMFLQHLQLDAPYKRWILKSSDHMYRLEALFSVFPDAFVVQTHRNPIEVIKSSADLSRVLHGLYGEADNPVDTLVHETRVLGEKIDRFIQFRDHHPELAHRIIDVKYPSLVRDPLAVIRTIYDRLQVPLNDDYADCVRRMASHRSCYRGPRASKEPFPLSFNGSAELGPLKRYCCRFGLPFQGAE